MIPDLIGLNQGSQTRGPPDVFVRPASTSKYCQLYLKLLFKAILAPIVAGADMFSPYEARKIFFFLKMWPSHRFEFETPGLNLQT